MASSSRRRLGVRPFRWWGDRRSGRPAAASLAVCALVGAGLVSLGGIATTASGHHSTWRPTASLGGKIALASVLKAVGPVPAVPPSDHLVGAAAASTPMKVDVVLQPRNPVALASFATAVSTPGNALYRHFLPRGRFAGVFGPTPAAIAEVTAYLRSAGLDPGTISPDHLILPVSTTVGAVEHGLHVSIRLFRQPAGSGAATALVNANAPMLPASLARDVQGIIGLDTVSSRPTGPIAAKPVAHPSATPSIAAARAPQACSQATSVARRFGGWTETQLAKAYSFDGEFTKGDLGGGTTIALFEEQTYSRQDIADFQACYRTHVPLTNVSVDHGSRDGDFSPEAALDIETVIGLAPKASLRIYETSGSGAGPTDGYDAIVTQDRAQVISSSWSSAPLNCDVFVPAAVIKAENSIFEEAASQGQSTYVATGDVGSEGCMSNGGSYEISAGSAGRGPAAVAVDPATRTVYVANFTSGTITVVGERSLDIVNTIRLGGSTKPDGLAVDPKTGQLWISETGAARVAEINGKTCDAATHSNCRITIVPGSAASGGEPQGVAINSSTATAYVAYEGLDAVGVFSEKTKRNVGQTVGGHGPTSVAVDARTNEVYYTADEDDAVGAFSGRNCDAASVSNCPKSPSGVTVGLDPVGVTVDAATNRLYVANYDSDTVSVLNAGTGQKVGAAVALAGHVGGPTSIAVAPGGTSLLVTGTGGGGAKSGVAVVSASRHTVTRVLTGGSTPVAVGVDANDGFAWVADFGALSSSTALHPQGKGILGVLQSRAAAKPGGIVWLPLLLSVEDPAGQPFVTAVGGTNLTKLGPAPSQSTWDEVRLGEGAGTGGISSRWAMPSYQKGPGVISSDSSGAPCGARAGRHCRELPDVSASADPSHGYVIVAGGSWTVVGGTSAATPLWAAVTSLLDATGGRVHRVGFLNPALYRLVGAGRRITTDVTAGNNDYTTTHGGLYPATRRYDMATGLGTPIVTALAAALR